MNFVLDNLNETVKAEVQKCNKIVLYGYSSGGHITYQYLLRRMPYINVAEFFNSANISKEQRDFVSQHPMKDTCMSALGNKLADFSADGQVIVSSDFNLFKKNYMNLNEETDTVCAPDNAVMGIVNIANSLTLFYSDISAPDFQLTYYNRLLYKYILEKGMFWITVNYREDSLSFPCERNLTNEEIESITNTDIGSCTGFIYEQSNVKGGILAMNHMSYLSKSKILSKAIAKAYADGCRYRCGNWCNQKTVNKCQKKLNVAP